jgi:hypothetical protein
MTSIIITILLISIVLSPFVYAINDNRVDIHQQNDELILKLIEETSEKYLIFDQKIGDINVKYWIHVKNDIEIKGDYILLHKTIDNKIQKYLKIWTDIDGDIPNIKENQFNDDRIFWGKIILFPDETDCLNFYKFNKNLKYPIICWEVRDYNGRTILYDLDWNEIGYGTPAPSVGFSLSGYNDATWPDTWIEYRQSADYWFQKWCTSTNSVSFPTPSEISSIIQDSSVQYFYELAHGDEYYFQADSEGSNYYAYNLKDDMANRQPLTFAFLGSCHGMTGTGPDTFSYEFRKGELTNTVTVGFDHMETCPGWEYGWYWQESLFENMSKGFTIKESFDSATSRYPSIEPAVVFVGDISVKANHAPNIPSTPEGNVNGESGVEYEYVSSTTDPELNQISYFFDWGDDSDSGWIGPLNSGDVVSATHTWDDQGEYEIRVKSKDTNDVESDWSDPLSIEMPHNLINYIYRFFYQIFSNNLISNY